MLAAAATLAAASEKLGVRERVWAVVPDGTPQEVIRRFRDVWPGRVYLDAGLAGLVGLRDVSKAELIDPRLWLRGLLSAHRRGSTSDMAQGGKMGALILVGPSNSIARSILQTSMHDEVTELDLQSLLL